MKINQNIFSFPPYISTSWNNIAALHVKEKTLTINLIDGETVEIPNLKSDILELIFDTHAKHLEEDAKQETSGNHAFGVFPFQQDQEGGQEIGIPFKFGIGTMDAWGAALQHNPSQAGMPNLPEEVLVKVRSIAKIIAPDDAQAMPKPEPHCNCMHCQVARAINQGLGLNDMYQKEEPQLETAESAPTKEELFLQEWDIQQAGDKLYTVIHKDDQNKEYRVYLGDPMGCTCGEQGCKHLIAVLKS